MSLKISTSIPYGNAGDICIEGINSGDTPEVSFAADPHGGPESLWFCLRLEHRKGGSAVKLTLKHTDNMLGGGQPANMRPVMRSAKSDWHRLPSGEVAVLPDGRKQVSWLVDAPAPWLDMAYCYPYGMPEVAQLIHETDGYWQQDTIGLSQGGRPLIRLSNDSGQTDGMRPGLYLMARQHSGETPGSWVLDGFLRRIATVGDAAPLVWVIPLANVDGVEQGDYGKDNFPYDLNRAWGAPPMRHEVLVYQRDIQRWKSRCQPVLGIDFHAPGACETDGIYGFLPNPETHPDAHQQASEWALAIQDELGPEYAADRFGRVANYRSRWETPGFAPHLYVHHGICAFTIENPYALVGQRVLTRERYQDAGRKIADSVLARLRTTVPPA